MFLKVKQQLQSRFDELANNTSLLFTVNPDREKIWELYLSGFDQSVRQSHNCNCCKSFMRQYGGVVTIVNNKVCTMWDINVDDEYKKSFKNVRDYVLSLPIQDVFLNTFPKLGTDFNLATLEDGSTVRWNHFFVTLPKQLVYKGNVSVESKQGEYRDTKNVFKRSLDELSVEASETVLELISQNSLYRGAEFKGLVESFYSLQKEYKNIPNKDKDNYCWTKCTTGLRIRNTAIGTLLVDISNGVDLDTAVSAFERVVAPTNYKRPNAIVTPKMVEEAKIKLTELGYLDSLERRHAIPSDLSVNDILYTQRTNVFNDVFDDMVKNVTVHPKTFAKVEEVSIDKFIKDIVPSSKGLEVLVEKGHKRNLVSLITAVNKDAPSMFKWNNPFSWAYAGGITDSMKERVKEAGGNVDGVLRFSIQWNEDGKSICDLDAHAIEPNGQRILYNSSFRKDRGNTFTAMSGQLDIDMIRPRGIGVENIYWKDISKMSYGNYTFIIKNYDGGMNSGYKAQIEFDGQIFDFSFEGNFKGEKQIAVVKYGPQGFSIDAQPNNTVSSEKIWNINTYQFVPVNIFMLSPNHWNNPTGNKHYMFFMEGCETEEKPRPFFNEFLKPELEKDKRFFETLGGKLEVQKTSPQLSGLGFSDTQRNHLYVRVTGNFKRVIKINF